MRRAAIKAIKTLTTGGIFAAGIFMFAASTNAEELSPESLIEEMSNALKTLNYEGSFVHLRDNNVEAMSIVHSNDHGGELEYMLSLNGEAREIFRDHSLVTCIWPGSKSVIVSESKSRNILPNVDASLTNKDFYELNMSKSDRVAGKETHVVDVKPIDEFRYGYRFWIDKETNMLLRSMLVDTDDNPIEQVMFTTISYPDSIDKERFNIPDDQIKLFDTKIAEASKLGDTDNRVEFSELPSGYAELSESYEPRPLSDHPMSHVMLSDGMASVSVYVEYIEKSAQEGLTLGVSSMGAMNAYTRSLDNALITVVGEVPNATVQSIARSVRLVE